MKGLFNKTFFKFVIGFSLILLVAFTAFVATSYMAVGTQGTKASVNDAGR